MRRFSRVEDVDVFRPLLDISPDTLAAFVADAGLLPAIDPSNAEPEYERTRWRNALVQLDELGLTEAELSRTAHRLQRIDRLAERVTDDFASAHLTRDDFGIVRLSRSAFVQAEAEIAIRVLARAMAAASGNRSYALARIEALAARIASETRFASTLGGARLEARDNILLVYREAGRTGIAPVDLAPGRTHVWDGRFAITPAVPVLVEPATAMTREGFAALTGTPLAGPVAGLRAAPLIRDRQGIVLALGALTLKPGVEVAQLPLTAWRANCSNRPPESPGALVSPE
jgi:tRNA(Ile)-lysidine synthase